MSSWEAILESSSPFKVLGLFQRRSHHLMVIPMPHLGWQRSYSLKSFPRGLGFLSVNVFYMYTFPTCLPSAIFQKAKTRKLFSWIFPKQHLIYYSTQRQHSEKRWPGRTERHKVILKRK